VPQDAPTTAQRSIARRRRNIEIGDKVRRGVDTEIGGVLNQRPAASAAALVGQNDSVDRGIEKATISRAGAGAGSAVQIDDGCSVGIAGALPVDLLEIARGEQPALVGLDAGEHSVTVAETVGASQTARCGVPPRAVPSRGALRAC
jgi:hypothetical protein